MCEKHEKTENQFQRKKKTKEKKRRKKIQRKEKLKKKIQRNKWETLGPSPRHCGGFVAQVGKKKWKKKISIQFDEWKSPQNLMILR